MNQEAAPPGISSQRSAQPAPIGREPDERSTLPARRRPSSPDSRGLRVPLGERIHGRRPGAAILATEEQPELALVDVRMPRLAAVELIRARREASPDTRIAVYTAEA